MKPETEKNLKAAFAGESQAHMRYLNFADRARGEGFSNVARLFEAASYAEQVHASKHLEALGGVGATASNLEQAFAGEDYEIKEMYPAFIALAKDQEEGPAATSMHRALEAEKMHRELYRRAQEAVNGKQDLVVGAIAVCSNCGYTVAGDPPDQCPVCSVKKEMFRAF
jgi:rubrerythrin